MIPKSHINDLILTGVPRSSTTLTCHLLNSLPDTVALHEPIPNLLNFGSVEKFPELVAAFFIESRNSLLIDGNVTTKHLDGVIPDNTFSDDRDELTQLRPHKNIKYGKIHFSKNLSRDFRFVVKHPAAFTATLPILLQHFPVYATVRNPLGVLLSWSGTDQNVNRGRSPSAEAFDRNLTQTLSTIDDVIDRRVYLLSWFYLQYALFLPQENIIRYEEVISSQGRALRVIAPYAYHLKVELENKNTNRLYDRKLLPQLTERLLREDGAWFEFYTKQDIENLYQRIMTDL